MAERPPLNATYQEQYRTCGKKTCRCREGQLHGPYWYAYWKEQGKMHSCYIGKKAEGGQRNG